MKSSWMMSLVATASWMGASLLAGCASSQKTMPHMGIGSIALEGQIARSDLVVGNPVEGTSKVTKILGGLVQIIEDDKIKILGIPLGFSDKYVYFEQSTLASDPFGYIFGFLGGPDAEDRAYYQALEKAQDADLVLVKSMDRDVSGFGWIFSKKVVRFRGKAMQVRSDS